MIRSLRNPNRQKMNTLMSTMLAIAVGATICATATAQPSRRQRKPPTAPKSGTSDTATTIASAASLEEPTDLAFATINGTRTTLASRERSIAAPPHFSQTELRVVDPGRRGSDALIPLRGYPTAERPTVPNHPGYADASIGLDMTANIDAGYAGSAWPFDYSARLGFNTSNGHAANNPHRTLGAAIAAGYIIDDGYGVFSGGHMGVDVRYDDATYRLYALPASPERSSGHWSVATSGANTTADLTYDATARYRSLTIGDSAASSRETSLEGTLGLSTSWKGFALGAQTDLRLTYLDGTSISYGRLHGYASYSNRFLTARAGVQLSAGANSDSSTSGTIAPVAELRLFPVQGLTIIGTITGGLAPTTLAAMSAINPYVALEPRIRQQRETIGYQVHVRIEPSRAFALRLSGARSHYNDYAYFESPVNGLFAPQYGSAIVNRITGDITWRVDDANSLMASTEFTDGAIDSRRALPFTPKWVADLLYTHRLTSAPLAIDIGGRYIGEREASAARTLDTVILMNAAARYAVTQRIDLSLELRNLLDRRYELWEGYTERGLFGAIGVAARF